MTGREYFIFGSTFIMGMFAGAFVFVTIYAPEHAKDSTDDSANNPNATVIEGHMYGGCDESGECASFKLVDDRTYTYLPNPDADIEKGRLPSDLTEEVFKNLGTEPFFTAATEVDPGACTSYVDGIDYTYDVTFEGDTYTLDTCTTALSYDEELQTTLAPVWEFMRYPTTTYPTILEKGVGGWFHDRFVNTRTK
jgi:hypothetical protein